MSGEREETIYQLPNQDYLQTERTKQWACHDHSVVTHIFAEIVGSYSGSDFAKGDIALATWPTSECRSGWCGCCSGWCAGFCAKMLCRPGYAGRFSNLLGAGAERCSNANLPLLRGENRTFQFPSGIYADVIFDGNETFLLSNFASNLTRLQQTHMEHPAGHSSLSWSFL